MSIDPNDYGKLRPEFKAEWLRRLRSGAYQQGKGYLRQTFPDGPVLCCLGVACEIAVDHGVLTAHPPTLMDEPQTTTAYRYDDKSATTLPPFPLTAWAYTVRPKQAWTVPYVGVEDDGTDAEPELLDLAELNDNYNLTFDQIADLVEEHL